MKDEYIYIVVNERVRVSMATMAMQTAYYIAEQIDNFKESEK